ncbi:proline--tRNA ligase [Candidatus Pacearchaeota archaeon]|nr:proline--tRNA ligase [Candidatus Pacearchaeota archaeon]|tara:strand:+ start:1423 stop:2853 length:1431 start_codon:yes stop_codon:yes gene_type:complete
MVNKKDEKGISVEKSKDISEWYTQVLQKAELADYAPIKGFMIIRPRAYYIWEKIQKEFDKVLERLKVKNTYFPLLIPENFFKKEAEHAEGFAPELAYIEGKEEGERLALRPTSETIMYDSYSKWIRSWRDLPLKLNQWANVIRWEVKQTKPFLRTREFLWQEGHCVFETEKEAREDMEKMALEYQKLVEGLLAVPLIVGKKSEAERFPGARETMTIEAFMPDGKALQCGTSHNLGQGFAKSFDVKFLDKNEKESYGWQTSWGFSTRLIGAMIMQHGDDKGLVLPPAVAREKVVIVPILFEDSREKVLNKAKEIEKSLKKWNAKVDDREEYKPGFKFSEHEMNGVPIRIEIGPKDLEKKTVVLVRRDTGDKELVKMSGIEKRVEKVLEEIQESLLEKAKKFLEGSISEAKDMDELKKELNKKKIVKVYMKDDKEVEGNVKDQTEGATSRIIEETKKEGECIVSGEKVNTVAYIAKAY